jgi:hypothetical protein
MDLTEVGVGACCSELNLKGFALAEVAGIKLLGCDVSRSNTVTDIATTPLIATYSASFSSNNSC